MYSPLDTNSLEAGLGASSAEYSDYLDSDQPLTSYTSLGTEYEAAEGGEEYSDYAEYEQELPSYLVPADSSYQAAPSIAVEYASPRDTRGAAAAEEEAEGGLVIDLTSARGEQGAATSTSAVYGQRILSLARRHRHRWAV